MEKFLETSPTVQNNKRWSKAWPGVGDRDGEGFKEGGPQNADLFPKIPGNLPDLQGSICISTETYLCKIKTYLEKMDNNVHW